MTGPGMFHIILLKLFLKLLLKLFLNMCVPYSNPVVTGGRKHTHTYVPRIRTMTSLILDPVVMDYLYLGINIGEKDMFLELSKDKIMIVLELS
jgi:hypothetical protein